MDYSESYYLADGFHRIAAAILADFQEFEAEVKQGNKRDAILYSCGANSAHGLRRTPGDRRKAVLKLLNDDEWKNWSQHKIASICHVDQSYVSKIKSSLMTVISDNPPPTTYIDKHGVTTTMKTGNIGKSKLPPEEMIKALDENKLSINNKRRVIT